MNISITQKTHRGCEGDGRVRRRHGRVPMLGVLVPDDTEEPLPDIASRTTRDIQVENTDVARGFDEVGGNLRREEFRIEDDIDITNGRCSDHIRMAVGLLSDPTEVGDEATDNVYF